MGAAGCGDTIYNYNIVQGEDAGRPRDASPHAEDAALDPKDAQAQPTQDGGSGTDASNEEPDAGQEEPGVVLKPVCRPSNGSSLGSITLSSNDEVRVFAGCQRIGKHVIIQGEAVTSLAGLEELQIIEGSLQIEGTRIVDLQPLRRVTSIGGDIIIEKNPALKSLMGLNAITAARAITIVENDALMTLAGLDSLESVQTLQLGGFGWWECSDDDLTNVRGNASLSTLEGLTRLRKVFSLTIAGNPKLQNLSGLERLEDVGQLNISKNDGLLSLEGLTRQVVVTFESVTIYGNAQLETLKGLEWLVGAGAGSARVSIVRNPMLTSLQGIEGLAESEVRGITITGNAALTKLTGFGSVTHMPGWLHIHSNPRLSNLSDLAQLRSIGHSLSIHSNRELASLAGLEQLETIAGQLEISGNMKLQNVDALANLDDIAGDVFLVPCWELFDEEELASRYTKRELLIRDNPLLTSLAGLDSIESTGFMLTVQNNQSLPSCEVSAFASIHMLQCTCGDNDQTATCE
jgi:hypothetical protein